MHKFDLKRLALPAAVMLAALGACDDSSDSPTSPGDPNDPNDPNGGSQAVVVGSVESAPGAATSVTVAYGPSYSFVESAEASTAAVAAVRADGSLDVLAEADIRADSRFRIENVPSGRTDLIVVARNENQVEVGRVIAHGRTEAGAELVTAPINAESTVEGRVFAELKGSGEANASTQSELALLLNMNESAAAAVATSETEIRAIATAFAESQQTMTRVFAEMGASLDGSARARAMSDLARRFAEERQSGASASAVHSNFAEASVDAFIAAGASTEAVAQAMASVTTGLDRAMVVANSSARLDVTRAAAELNLVARERAAATLESDFGARAQAVGSAMLRSRSQVNAAVSLSELKAALRASSEESNQVVNEFVLGVITDLNLDAAVQAEIQSRLESTFAAADLSARFEGSTSADADAMATLIAQHHSEVQAEVDALIEAMPEGASVNADAMVRLLITAGAAGHVS